MPAEQALLNICKGGKPSVIIPASGLAMFWQWFALPVITVRGSLYEINQNIQSVYQFNPDSFSVCPSFIPGHVRHGLNDRNQRQINADEFP